MSVSIQTVEFERRDAYLSGLEGDAPWTVHGIALGAGDVTVGQSGIKKLWPAEELEKAAESLEGRNLVVDHNNKSDGVVGQVTKSGYKDGTGVIYEAELFDEELAEKIENGLLEVSIRGKHNSVEEMDENDDGAKIVESITFDNLSIVPNGAAPSNTIEVGETDELSMAELSEFTDDLERAELQEIEPGMWVTDGDIHGITVGQVEDGEVEVDVYEEDDGAWRPVGETTVLDTDSLDEWDVDEDDVEPMDDDESEDESEEEESMKTTESDEVEELQAVHEPDWSSTADKEWNKPSLEDFTDESWEDLSEEEQSDIADHFLVSKTGEFPPENYGDLALPVVEPDGTLNLNALSNAKARAGQVSGVSGDDEDRIVSKIDRLANENFDDASFGEDEEEASEDTEDESVDDDVTPVSVLTGDDLWQSDKSKESELDDATYKVLNMTEDIEQKLAELNEPVAVEQDDLEELQDKADRFDEMSESLESLKERTDILDEVDQEKIEELRDSDEPVVVESARFESLEAEAEQVKEVYAAALSEEMPAFSGEELADRFSIEELRDKYEEQIGDPAEELASSESAEPRSGDVEEEELEQRAESESEETEEASETDEADEMRAELKDKILG